MLVDAHVEVPEFRSRERVLGKEAGQLVDDRPVGDKGAVEVPVEIGLVEKERVVRPILGGEQRRNRSMKGMSACSRR
jgi:hypothetical protein